MSARALDPDWLDEEAGQPGVWRELKRLGRRAGRRWALTLAVALALTGAVVGLEAHKPRSYESRVVFRITEGDVDAESAPHTNGRLKEYVSDVVFANLKLAALIKKHGLYPSLAARDMTLAIESMRDDIDVDVWRNYFALPHSADDPARSARVSIAFHGRDKQVVYDTVRDLGQLLLEHEQRSRVAQAEVAMRLADDESDAARALVRRRNRELTETELAREHARTPAEALTLLVAAHDLERAVLRAQALVDKADAKREKMYLRLQLEKRALGMRVELIDGGRVAREGLSRKLALLILAIITFVVGLPLSSVAVGAFDDRIYDAEDVRRLGLGVVGAVRHFEGDNAGALSERLRAEGHARLGPS